MYNAIMRKYVLLALSLFGLFDSLYLWWAYTSPSRPIVCTGGGCETVRASEYAHLWGHPLPLYGVVMYLVLVVLIFVQPLLGAALARRIVQITVSAIACLGFLFSVYLTDLEAFVIHAWCTWCVTSAIAVTLIFLLGLWETIRPEAPPDPAMALRVVQREFALIALAALVGIPAFLHLQQVETLKPVEKSSAQVISEHLVRPDSHVTGNPQALVTLVEFGDFECPICGQEDVAVSQIRRDFGDKVRFVFRQFPLPSLHPQAEKAAEASECAADQGKFWEMHNQIYANQKDLSVPALERDAAAIGLDQQIFKHCLESGATAARVQRDRDDAHALHLRATPTFVMGDHVLEGAVPYEDLASLLNEGLAHRGTETASGRNPAGPAGDISARTRAGSEKKVGQAPKSNTNTSTDANRNARNANSASVANLSSSPDAGSQSDLGSSGFGGGSKVGFAPLGSELTCSEDEAKKRQPAEIQTPAAKSLHDSGQAAFVDVRSSSDFAKGHIAGAVNIPADELDRRWQTLPEGKTVILYESGNSPGDVCAQSRAAGRILFNHGIRFNLVKVYKDGLAGWEKAGLPVER